jgi:hypothetical protein
MRRRTRRYMLSAPTNTRRDLQPRRSTYIRTVEEPLLAAPHQRDSVHPKGTTKVSNDPALGLSSFLSTLLCSKQQPQKLRDVWQSTKRYCSLPRLTCFIGTVLSQVISGGTSIALEQSTNMVIMGVFRLGEVDADSGESGNSATPY